MRRHGSIWVGWLTRTAARASVAALSLVVLLAAGPVAAQTFRPPDACKLIGTVQLRDCSSWQIMSCEPRTNDRVIYEHREGAVAAVYVYEAGLLLVQDQNVTQGYTAIFTYDDLAGALAFDPAAPVTSQISGSIRMTPANALDGARFAGESTGGQGVLEVSGRRLTVIDELSLLEAPALGAQMRGVGRTFYAPEWGSVVGGVYEIEFIGVQAPSEVTDQTPISLSGPDEPGYGSIASPAACMNASADWPARAVR